MRILSELLPWRKKPKEETQAKPNPYSLYEAAAALTIDFSSLTPQEGKVADAVDNLTCLYEMNVRRGLLLSATSVKTPQEMMSVILGRLDNFYFPHGLPGEGWNQNHNALDEKRKRERAESLRIIAQYEGLDTLVSDKWVAESLRQRAGLPKQNP